MEIMSESYEPAYQTPRNAEILQNGKYSVVVSNDPSRAELASQALNEVKNGIPDNWKNYRYSKEQPNDNLRVDNLTNPTYFGKFRNYLSRPGNSPAQRSQKSILSEFRMAPVVEKVLETESMKDIAKTFKFDEIRFIPPLVGLINNETGEKAVIYEWVNAHSTVHDTSNPSEPNMFDKHFKENGRDPAMLEDILKSVFQINGIIPGDFGMHNLMVGEDDDKKILYVHDIEGFALKKN